MPSSEGAGHANGHHDSRPRNKVHPLVPGIYVPTPAFFEDGADEAVDLNSVGRHAVRLARAGVTGLAVQGSNGEAVHLLDSERDHITQTTRAALDGAGFQDMPLIVGCAAQSTRQTIELCKQAALNGGDAALVLPPAYYQGLFDKDTVFRFFIDVADASPIPIVIYNYPAAVSGLDLSSDTLIALGKAHRNIVGAKFTCGNTGKLGRVAAEFTGAPVPGTGPDEAYADEYPDFLCFAGAGDFLTPAMAAGAAGVIPGIANVAPTTVVKLYRSLAKGQGDQRLQRILARGDWAAIKTGAVGVKVALQEYFGYGGWARKPLPRPEGETRKEIVEGFRELVELEKSLAGSA
jgi:4-hydroxy-2-oxoglutarate aldolase